MKRRGFLASILGLFGLGAVAAPKSEFEHVEEAFDKLPFEAGKWEVHQYDGAYLADGGCTDAEMPAALKAKCRERARAIAGLVGGEIVEEDLFWVPTAPDCDKAVAAFKIGVRVFVTSAEIAKREAKLLADGWRPSWMAPIKAGAAECEVMDAEFGGKLERFYRPKYRGVVLYGNG